MTIEHDDEAWRSIPPHELELFCPSCGKQHLDIGEFATRVHRKHLCENTPEGPKTGCGHLWVPFQYATKGVDKPKPDTELARLVEELDALCRKVVGDMNEATREQRLTKYHDALTMAWPAISAALRQAAAQQEHAERHERDARDRQRDAERERDALKKRLGEAEARLARAMRVVEAAKKQLDWDHRIGTDELRDTVEAQGFAEKAPTT